MSFVFENVTKVNRGRRGTQTVLRDVSFVLPEGRSVGILGQRNSGKSTLIHLLCGAIQPSEGAIGALPPDVRIGWCSQQQAIDWYLDVWHNVIMGARLAGMGRAESRRLRMIERQRQ